MLGKGSYSWDNFRSKIISRFFFNCYLTFPEFQKRVKKCQTWRNRISPNFSSPNQKQFGTNSWHCFIKINKNITSRYLILQNFTHSSWEIEAIRLPSCETSNFSTPNPFSWWPTVPENKNLINQQKQQKQDWKGFRLE